MLEEVAKRWAPAALSVRFVRCDAWHDGRHARSPSSGSGIAVSGVRDPPVTGRTARRAAAMAACRSRWPAPGHRRDARLRRPCTRAVRWTRATPNTPPAGMLPAGTCCCRTASPGAANRRSVAKRAANESITVAMRRDDVNAALGWLAAAAGRRCESHRAGRMVQRRFDRAADDLPARTGRSRRSAAIALYPSCAASLRQESYATAVPLLLLVGAVDDWTPPQPCEDARATRHRTQARQPLELVVYATATMASTAPRCARSGHPQRTDVTGGRRSRAVSMSRGSIRRPSRGYASRSDYFLRRLPRLT